MSHQDDCPHPWDARREGARAAERDLGEWRNPYRETCDEAARAWRSGYERAEEERHEQEREERRIEAHQRELRAQQDYFEEQAQQQEYYAQQDDQERARYATEQAEQLPEPEEPPA